MKLKLAIAIGALALLAAPASAQDVEAGKKVFNRCKACHDVEKGQNKVGPHLDGVIGRTAGTVPDYAYSEAMKAAGAGGLVWDDAKITEYMLKPKDMIPGNKMAFAGLKKPEDIINLIAYLKTFPAK